MPKKNDEKQFVRRDPKETEAYNRNKRNDRTPSQREYVQKVVAKIAREHRPALDWLADK